ncbi:hypothetical protein FNF27_04646 [Cafeteria roenbergensis]|uniref:tRNA/rRNA methyltransferase SpoU type domain-containing protein n=1 Tax=Cafeteria roenbergensis TaxID=33653 RepID=A0A5A8CL66_CAFRO|nr:hypothetical protein FNF29_02841 [Cafeteria roenbergensis]KAA0163127.1 hypothetical protein FNF31_02950 [Cafeteria roenbergensis]KAA0164509.1 hypothetical protein FNF28_03850 [Cafeteria roenbergensis]KAA0173890.1 hypothetical protein FNF27_04646 [Cafeteria roenbergensis]|eukprot:KAA0153852.1 hypothetical protein FNF29_02841 [Cafeteria roenbergensis]
MASASSAAAAPASEDRIGLPPRLRRAETVLRMRTDRIVLVLEHSTDFQNIAACVRTAESFGIQTVYVVQSATMRKDHALSSQRDEGDIRAVLRAAAGEDDSPSTPVVSTGDADEAAEPSALGVKLSASKAAHAWVDLKPMGSIAECVEALRADGRTIWATDLTPGAQLLATPGEAAVLRGMGLYGNSGPVEGEAATAPGPAPAGMTCLPRKLAIVMGRETDGISPAFRAAADSVVFLPMYGFAESFNLSVATALVLQRLLEICPEAHGEMSLERRAGLRRDWFERLLRSTSLRGDHERFISMAGADDAARGDKATAGDGLLMTDLRRGNKRAMWNKKMKRRLGAVDEQMGRFDVEAAVTASKRGRMEAQRDVGDAAATAAATPAAAAAAAAGEEAAEQPTA